MKKSFLSILFAFTFFYVFAVPGVNQFIPDASGEYVYYKDSTFTRESYIGILVYDDANYKIRYYAPTDTAAKLPEKEMSILVSVNKDSNFWDMTGEFIMTPVLPGTEDADLINYLHDVLYEFSARRNKMEVVDGMNVSSIQDYAQFGGSVTIFFDAVIPIFNIRDIIDANGQKVLECICIGKLNSSEDKGFDSFKGFPQGDEKDDVEKIKAGKAMKVSYDGKSVKLDSNWTQSLENFWTLGDEALLTMAFVPLASENENLNNLYIVRKLMSSSQTSYINFPKSTVNIKKNGDMIFNCDSYDAASNKNIITNKILKKKKSGGYDFLSLAVYKENYEINKSYFDKIIKSFK